MQFQFWRFLLVSVFIGVSACAIWRWQHGLAASVLHDSMHVDGNLRSYRLVIPDGSAKGPLRPLVVALHGALDTTDEMAKYTQLDVLAIEKNFLLVYPQGRNLNWAPIIPAENPEVSEPDFRFIDDLCEHLKQEYPVDPKRVYVVGVSMSGAMCNQIIASRSERFAAAVCNCGWLPAPLDTLPMNTKNKCPMLFISGTEDRQVTPAQVKAAKDAFDREGHPTTLLTIPGYGHGWAHKLGINEEVWAFLAEKHL